MPQEISWVSLTSAPNRLMAEITRGLLEAAGMPVMLAGESYATTYGLPEAVEILVPSDRLAEAQALLEAETDSSADVSEAEGDDEPA